MFPVELFTDDCQVFCRSKENGDMWYGEVLSAERMGICHIYGISVFSAANYKGIN